LIKVYGFSSSGNCYKIKLLLTLLEKEYEWIEINSLKGETRTSEFLDKNLNGKIPLLELDNGDFLAESGAILFYLSQNTSFLPEDILKNLKFYNGFFLNNIVMSHILLLIEE
jgi:glutathione S-transferase